MPRTGLLAALFLVCLWQAGAAFWSNTEPFSKDELRQRRAALRASSPDAIFILFGRTEADENLRSRFFQEPNFFYLTGWSEPGAILILTPVREVLLLPSRDKEKELWTGTRAAPDGPEIKAITGFDEVGGTETLEARLPRSIADARRIYTLAATSDGVRLKALLPMREIADAALPIARLRMKKSPAEIAAIQNSTNATVEAHRRAFKAVRPGAVEFQVANAMTSVYFDRGCERNAYTPIVASGPNGTILHYTRNSRTLQSGELVILDVGAECSMYASDITRTLPVSGRFTPRQRELYEVVLGAQKAAIAAVKPGAVFGSRSTQNGLYKVAIDYLDAHGKDKSGKGLGQYMKHGLGHHVGLDVHDSADSSVPLAAGMVITIEPGVYLPDEGIGMRIEDLVLVTENGAKVLSSALPKDPASIEHAMAH